MPATPFCIPILWNPLGPLNRILMSYICPLDPLSSVSHMFINLLFGRGTNPRYVLFLLPFNLTHWGFHLYPNVFSLAI